MPPQPNIPALLARLAAGDASALAPLRAAAPPEAEAAAEAFLRTAIAKGDPADETAVEAIGLLAAIESPGAAPVVARALTHPNARVRDAAALAVGEMGYYLAIERLRTVRSDAALDALEKLFERHFYGSFLGHIFSRPRRIDGKRDWSEFDAFWEAEGKEIPDPPMLPEEVVGDRLIDIVLRRLPGSHRILERMGYRCVGRVGKDMDTCVAVEKESLDEAARLHGKPLEPLLAALTALARKIQAEELAAIPPVIEITDEVETVEGP
ncbi:MAG: HEAT repeat domain-containing protein [Planctomycetes bacterium]|nr:HEAT repeat domain-containing protein [Planctomycetota bacterium]